MTSIKTVMGAVAIAAALATSAPAAEVLGSLADRLCLPRTAEPACRLVAVEALCGPLTAGEGETVHRICIEEAEASLVAQWKPRPVPRPARAHLAARR